MGGDLKPPRRIWGRLSGGKYSLLAKIVDLVYGEAQGLRNGLSGKPAIAPDHADLASGTIRAGRGYLIGETDPLDDTLMELIPFAAEVALAIEFMGNLRSVRIWQLPARNRWRQWGSELLYGEAGGALP